MNDIDFIQQKLESYRAASPIEEDHALREILQEYILAAFARTDYFSKASFHGGTHLRIFHGLRRFSEDLDFALLAPDSKFNLKPYLDKAAQELDAIGLKVEVKDKSKADVTVKKGFLKDDSLVRLVQLQYPSNFGNRQTPRKILIKVEVDTNPPAGATHVTRDLRFPFRAPVMNFDLPSSFSGKMHALLCRTYVKGRDWYDFDWYSAQAVKLNHRLLSAALNQQGQWAGAGIETNDEWVKSELKKVIARLDWKRAQEDVAAFVRPSELRILDCFNADYFAALADRIGNSGAAGNGGT